MGDVTRREFDTAVEKIGEYLHKFSGSKPSFTEDTSDPGNWFTSAHVSHLGVTTQVVVVKFKTEQSIDVIFNAAAVMLPNENLVAFFRQLLVWNYVATDVAHYALNESANAIVMVFRRPFEGFDYSEFKDALETISKVNFQGLILLRQLFRV